MARAIDDSHPSDRRAPSGLVHGPHQSQYAAAGRLRRAVSSTTPTDYSDDLPFWTQVSGRPHLIVPYTLEANDMRFSGTGLEHRRAVLFLPEGRLRRALRRGRDGAEDVVDRPALPDRRPAGQDGRAWSVSSATRWTIKDVWFARRIEIARHWREVHPYVALREDFVAKFGHGLRGLALGRRGRAGPIRQQTWRAWRRPWPPWSDAAPRARKLALIRAHPELASRTKMAEASVRRSRPASAWTSAARRSSKAFQAAERRLQRPLRLSLHLRGEGRHPEPTFWPLSRPGSATIPEVEFETAIAQIHRIAGFRLADLL